MMRREGLAPSPLWGEGWGEGHASHHPHPNPLPQAGEGVSRRAFLAVSLAAAVTGARAQGRIERFTGDSGLAGFHAVDFDGKPVAVPAPGKPTVVNFWATWCEPCRAEMPLLQQMADFYSDRLVFQAVNFKERAVTVQRHVRSANWAVPVVLDPMGAGAQSWGVKVFPTTVGFDAQGRARWRVVGQYDWSSADAGKLVESLWA
jgi:thiol-disulfide isomerase/thioredoxin